MIKSTTSYQDRTPLVEAFFKKMEAMGDKIQDCDDYKSTKSSVSLQPTQTSPTKSKVSEGKSPQKAKK